MERREGSVLVSIQEQDLKWPCFFSFINDYNIIVSVLMVGRSIGQGGIMLKKHFLFPASVLVFIFIFNSGALYAETYYINNSRVLLYKLINWWYDCLPDESDALCGSLVKYERRSHVIVEYDKNTKNLILKTEGGFAAQLSVPNLKCTWLDKTYFGGSKLSDITTQQFSAGEVTVKNIDVHQYRRIQNILQYLMFELEGKIVGLLNGQIALHRTSPLIKTCPVSLKGPEKNSEISFRIINVLTKEVIAIYSTALKP